MWYAIVLAVGLVLAAIGFVMLKNSIGFIRTSQRAMATVIRLDPVTDSDGTTYKAVFSFRTLTNREIIYYQNGSSRPASWSVGDTAEIAYDAAKPENAKLLTYWGSFVGTIILMAIAAPMLVIGGGYYLLKPFLR
ncbi:MAG: DUF3592 domain-containing protein [Chitinophagaceae bacterium]|nr:MAG: DUF3592 domain-containing protein [Chitinophagaceae bacterium]